MPLLNPGDPFPRLTITTTDGQSLTIPDAFAGDREQAFRNLFVAGHRRAGREPERHIRGSKRRAHRADFPRQGGHRK